MAEFFQINELSKASGVNSETIRYYEKQGLIAPALRQSNGYRLFGKPHISQLHFIKTCRMLGFGLDEIKQLIQLQADPNNPCDKVDELAKQHLQIINQQIEQRLKIKNLLEPLVDCTCRDVEKCRILKGIDDI